MGDGSESTYPIYFCGNDSIPTRPYSVGWRRCATFALNTALALIAQVKLMHELATYALSDFNIYLSCAKHASVAHNHALRMHI